LWVVGTFLVADAGPSQVTSQSSEYEVYEGLYKKTGYEISLPEKPNNRELNDENVLLKMRFHAISMVMNHFQSNATDAEQTRRVRSGRRR